MWHDARMWLNVVHSHDTRTLQWQVMQSRRTLRKRCVLVQSGRWWPRIMGIPKITYVDLSCMLMKQLNAYYWDIVGLMLCWKDVIIWFKSPRIPRGLRTWNHAINHGTESRRNCKFGTEEIIYVWGAQGKRTQALKGNVEQTVGRHRRAMTNILAIQF